MERVYLLQAGQVDMECVLLVNADGIFVSRINYINAQSATGLGSGAQRFLSPGNARFDLVHQMSWKLIRAIEPRLPPPGQHVPRIPVVFTGVDLTIGCAEVVVARPCGARKKPCH